MPETINTSTELSDYQQITSLDGSDFILRFLFNQREAKWYLDIADKDGVAIVNGIKIVVGISLLRKVTDARRPPGLLTAMDTTVRDIEDFAAGDQSLQIDPGLNDLGAGVILIYYPRAELV